MKKFIYILFVVSIVLTSCEAKKTPNASVDAVMGKIKEKAKFSDSEEEDLKDLKVAERYGIDAADISEGKVYSTKAAENIDKIILVKAKDKDATQRVERALGSAIVRLSDAWVNNETEYKKVRDHIIKSSGNYIIMIVCDNPKEIETIFDLM